MKGQIMPLRHLAKLGMSRKSHDSKHVTSLHLSLVPNYSPFSATPFSAPMPAPTQAPTPAQELPIDMFSYISNLMPQKSLICYT